MLYAATHVLPHRSVIPLQASLPLGYCTSHCIKRSFALSRLQLSRSLRSISSLLAFKLTSTVLVSGYSHNPNLSTNLSFILLSSLEAYMTKDNPTSPIHV